MALAVLFETEEKNNPKALKKREEIRMKIKERRNCFPSIPPMVKARKKNGRVVARRRAEKRKEERTFPKITVKGLRGETNRKESVFCSLSPVIKLLEKAGETTATNPNKMKRSPANISLFAVQGVSDLRTK